MALCVPLSLFLSSVAAVSQSVSLSVSPSRGDGGLGAPPSSHLTFSLSVISQSPRLSTLRQGSWVMRSKPRLVMRVQP